MTDRPTSGGRSGPESDREAWQRNHEGARRRSPDPAEAAHSAAVAQAPSARASGQTGDEPTRAVSPRRGMNPALWIGGIIVVALLVIVAVAAT